ncbi:hypothetical protein SPHINGOR109_50165 [Sphingorhabdus sp. 109]|nr:hypothetical protein SPHINGOR109_50165 [Sphingorhabdus sp. 109]
MVADAGGLAASLIVPIDCYAVIASYGLYAARRLISGSRMRAVVACHSCWYRCHLIDGEIL